MLNVKRQPILTFTASKQMFFKRICNFNSILALQNAFFTFKMQCFVLSVIYCF
jgi:hypothetical protein